jgi:hypothetical protein
MNIDPVRSCGSTKAFLLGPTRRGDIVLTICDDARDLNYLVHSHIQTSHLRRPQVMSDRLNTKRKNRSHRLPHNQSRPSVFRPAWPTGNGSSFSFGRLVIKDSEFSNFQLGNSVPPSGLGPGPGLPMALGSPTQENYWPVH